MAERLRQTGKTTTEGTDDVVQEEAAREAAGVAPGVGTGMTAKRTLENTKAIRVLEALDRYRCPICRRNNPKIYCTKGRARYVRCTGCGRRGVVIADA